MRVVITAVVVPSLLAAAVGCVRTAPAPMTGYWVASDSSRYSPTVRVHATTDWNGSALVVALDSGVIAVPGTFSVQSPLMMHDLYLVAYVAVSNATPMGLVRDDRAQFADRRGWRIAAASDSVRLADQLRFGERRAIGSVRFRLSGAPEGVGAAWLVLGITGESVDLRVPFDETAGLKAGAPGKRSIRVYACSERDLDGRLDTARSNGMRRAYGAVC